jgi:NADH-quinone oxidoreductase subunit C
MTTDTPDEPVTADEPVAPDKHYGFPCSASRGQDVIHVPREQLADAVMELRDEHGFNLCVDVTASDYIAYSAPRHLPASVEPERYEVVIALLSMRDRTRLRIRVQVPENDPVVPSLFDVHPGTEALEREVFDMFGIRFDGHPDLTRILMPEDWIGHPLRKDYAIGAIPVQFKGIENAR